MNGQVADATAILCKPPKYRWVEVSGEIKWRGKKRRCQVPCAPWDFQLLAQYDTVDGTPVLMTL